MKRTDPLTQETFYPKRTNQKFANRENQIRYNNQKAKSKRDTKYLLDKILDKNRNIISKLLDKDSERYLSREFLLGAGFHFGCLTHSIELNGILITCIYEYGYQKISNDEYKILKHA